MKKCGGQSSSFAPFACFNFLSRAGVAAYVRRLRLSCFAIGTRFATMAISHNGAHPVKLIPKPGRLRLPYRQFLPAAMASRFSVVRKNKVPPEMAGVVKQMPPSLLVAATLNFSVAGMTKTSPCSPVK